MGYKFGGHVNIGYNPDFVPTIVNGPTNQNGAMVVGQSNQIEGNSSVAIGQNNRVLLTTSRSCVAMGTGNRVSGNVGNVCLGFSGDIHASAAYAVALGYSPDIGSTGFGGTAVGASKADGLLAIAMGFGSTGSANYTIAMGQSAKATAASAVAIGTGGTGSASLAIGLGGVASASKAIAIGSGATAATSGSIALGRGSMSAGRLGGFRLNPNGGKDTTSSYQVCQSLGATTDATPTKIFLASGGSTDGNLVIGTSTTVQFTVWVQASKSDSSADGACYKLEGAVTRDNNASNNPTLLGSVSKTVIHESDAGMDVGITIDNTTKALDLTVTGKAATNFNWCATWHLHQNQ